MQQLFPDILQPAVQPYDPWWKGNEWGEPYQHLSSLPGPWEGEPEQSPTVLLTEETAQSSQDVGGQNTQDRVSRTRTEFSSHTDNRDPNLVNTFIVWFLFICYASPKKLLKKKKSRHNNLNFRLPSIRDKEKINRE